MKAPQSCDNLDNVDSQGDLFIQLKGTYTASDRLALHRATKSGKIQRVPGPKPKDVCYKRAEFLEWIGTTHYADHLTPEGETMPAGTSENTDSSPQSLCADAAHGDVGIRSGGQLETDVGEEHAVQDGICQGCAISVDIEVVDEHATPRATVELACIARAGVTTDLDRDEADFRKYDADVRKGLREFITVGLALREINSRRLYRAGGFNTWQDYTKTYGDITKSYASRIMGAAGIAVRIAERLPIGNLLPNTESQVRPLARLDEPSRQVEAWITATKRAGDAQPSGKLVAEVVAEMVGTTGVLPPPVPDPKPDITRSFNEIFDAVCAGRPHHEIEVLLTAFGLLIGVSKPSSNHQP